MPSSYLEVLLRQLLVLVEQRHRLGVFVVGGGGPEVRLEQEVHFVQIGVGTIWRGLRALYSRFYRRVFGTCLWKKYVNKRCYKQGRNVELMPAFGEDKHAVRCVGY